MHCRGCCRWVVPQMQWAAHTMPVFVWLALNEFSGIMLSATCFITGLSGQAFSPKKRSRGCFYPNAVAMRTWHGVGRLTFLLRRLISVPLLPLIWPLRPPSDRRALVTQRRKVHKSPAAAIAYISAVLAPNGPISTRHKNANPKESPSALSSLKALAPGNRKLPTSPRPCHAPLLPVSIAMLPSFTVTSSKSCAWLSEAIAAELPSPDVLSLCRRCCPSGHHVTGTLAPCGARWCWWLSMTSEASCAGGSGRHVPCRALLCQSSFACFLSVAVSVLPAPTLACRAPGCCFFLNFWLLASGCPTGCKFFPCRWYLAF